ncbi:MAG: metallophosphoesterase [Bacteroidota bacterium]
MRNLFLLILLFLFDLFAFQALAQVAAFWPDVLRNFSYLLYWSIPVGAVALSFVLLRNGREALRSKGIADARSVVFIAYFAKFLIAVLLLLEDVFRLLVQLVAWLGLLDWSMPNRTLWVSQLALLLGGLLFGLMTHGILRNKYRYKVFRERISIPGLPNKLKGLRIVQISDIHSGSFTDPEKVSEGVALVNAQKPDLVFFTGDLVNSMAREMQDYISVFKNIKARYGVYSILGNHDYGDYVRWPSPEAKQQNFQDLLNVHQRMGWDLMLNENRLLEIEGEQVAVIGVENYSASARFHTYGDLLKAYKGAERAVLKLLLSHDPSHWEDQVVKDFPDIDITFSGHTHGMQFGIEIPGWIKWSPAKYVYKQWGGLYQRKRQYLYVNRGFGFLGYPGRVGILPEVTVVEIV